MKRFLWLFLFIFLPPAAIEGAGPRTIIKPPAGYDHARFSPDADIRREFRAFIVSFDSKDDNNDDDVSDLLRVPHWVAQEICRWEPPETLRADENAWCLNTLKKRPTWFTDAKLFRSGVAPNDASYRNSGYERGHLAMKLLAERLGQDAAYNTHTVLNAVPQHGKFNKGIWQKLEYLTGAWAQEYGVVWVIQGPVFLDTPYKWIGDEGEREVAIPDAIFKIVFREKTSEEKSAAAPKDKDIPEVLAFLFPQLGPGYFGSTKDFRHKRFLTTIDEIEELTDLEFKMKKGRKRVPLPKRFKRHRKDAIWSPSVVNLKDKRKFLSGCRGS